MKHALHILLAIAGISAVPLAASAQTGWYVAVDGGASGMKDGRLDIRSVALVSYNVAQLPPGYVEPPNADGPSATVYPNGDDLASGRRDLHTSPGGTGLIRVGHRLTPHWRIELELGSCSGGLKSDHVRSGFGTDGTIGVGATMINAIYDFAPERRLQPFIGVGVGLASQKGRIAEYYSSAYDRRITGRLFGWSTSVGGYSEGFAYRSRGSAAASQWLAGVAWSLSPKTQLDLTYRDLTISHAPQAIALNSHYTLTSQECPICAAVAPFETTSAYQGRGAVNMRDQSLTLGLRWFFGVAKP